MALWIDVCRVARPFPQLVALFAIYALLGGVTSVAGALRHRKKNEEWWLPFLLGLAAIGTGAIAVFRPALTLLVLVLLIGAHALVSGVLDLTMALRLRRTLRGERLLLFNATLSILFGVLVFLVPDAGALAIAWMISIYALLTRSLLMTLAFRLRRHTIGERRAARERRIVPDRRVMSVH